MDGGGFLKNTLWGMMMMDVRMRRMVSRLRRGVRGRGDKFWGMSWSKGDERPILRPGEICADVNIWINLGLFSGAACDFC